MLFSHLLIWIVGGQAKNDRKKYIADSTVVPLIVINTLIIVYALVLG